MIRVETKAESRFNTPLMNFGWAPRHNASLELQIHQSLVCVCVCVTLVIKPFMKEWEQKPLEVEGKLTAPLEFVSL